MPEPRTTDTARKPVGRQRQTARLPRRRWPAPVRSGFGPKRGLGFDERPTRRFRADLGRALDLAVEIDQSVQTAFAARHALQRLQFDRLGLDVEKNSPAAHRARAEHERQIMVVAAGVGETVRRAGRDGHGIALGHFAPLMRQQRIAAQFAHAEMDFDPLLVLVARDAGRFAGQKSHVPGMVVAIDQRNDGDAQVRDDKAGLCRHLVIAGAGDAARLGDPLDAERESDREPFAFRSSWRTKASNSSRARRSSVS